MMKRKRKWTCQQLVMFPEEDAANPENKSTSSFHKGEKEDTIDKRSRQSKKSKSSKADTKTPVECQSEHKSNGSKHPEKESCGTKSVTDNKSDKSSKSRPKNADSDEFDLVPSSLPNASPTQVVNEWLKSITTDGDMYDMEELTEECDGQKCVTEGINGIEDSESNNNSVAENANDTNEGMKDDKTSTEAPKANTNCTQSEDAFPIFHSSVQVMKVLLSPKLDRCNSLPEVSPVYGRKLSTSAKGLLDCLVKLQLIDHDPKHANEKNLQYQELMMNILKSLWLCDRPESEDISKRDDHHSVDDECNHTSSSGVDVNSGSTGSGKSSNGANARKEQEVCEGEADKCPQSTPEGDVEGIGEEKPKEDDPESDDTIRNNDSPRELPETPPSSSKSSGNDSSGPKVPEEAETDCREDTCSGSPPLTERADLAKRFFSRP